MNTGSLNRTITISALNEAVSAGNVTTTWGTPETIRAYVKQLDGSRFINNAELVDKVLYEIRFWDNGYGNQIKITMDGVDYFPVQPLTKNPGKSNLNEVKAIVTRK
jgi:head-tail adaptor